MLIPLYMALSGRKQDTSQGERWRPWRGITSVTGAVDEAGQRPGKERHSPHDSNVQEGTCCLGRQRKHVSIHQPSLCPQNPHAPMPVICYCSQQRCKTHIASREGQTPGGLNRLSTLAQPPFIILTARASGCKSRRRTLPGQAAEVKGRELTMMAHSHAGGSSHHPSAYPHRPGTGYSGGVSGIEVTHLQRDVCTFPLFRPLYSQPCEGCSHHQGS